ncbi:Hypothetical predicted protein [Scomber scombrus]|uniref:Uncharacterized protein n=1 Tax=Scomber scombrus TaxID=13677 RepID=A0AAV1NQR0_SCOSC
MTTHTHTLSPSCCVCLLLARPLLRQPLIGRRTLAGFAPPRDYYCRCSQRGNTQEQKFSRVVAPSDASLNTTCSVNRSPAGGQEAEISNRNTETVSQMDELCPVFRELKRNVCVLKLGNSCVHTCLTL